MRRVMIAFAIALAQAVAFAQSPPAFEVASIKPSSDPPGSSGINTRPGSLLAVNVTLRGTIHSAYNIPEARIFGGPKWIDQDRFYIQARATTPADDAELMTMLQSLLAERFALVVHRETRTLPGYELVV